MYFSAGLATGVQALRSGAIWDLNWCMRDFPDLSACVDALEGHRVLVVGDIMLDRYVHGSVDRVSQEGPVPVLKVTREEESLGAAGNVLVNLRELGVDPHIVSVTGTDSAGERLREIAEAYGLDLSGLIADPSRPTTVKTRFVARNQQLLRTDYEQSCELGAAAQEAALTRIRDRLHFCSALILSDYAKGMLDNDLIRKVIDLAHAESVPVVIDPKGSDYSRYRGADWITPNRKELSEAAGTSPGTSLCLSDDAIANAALNVLRGAGIGGMFATRSEDGVTLITADGAAPQHFRAAAREVFDVSGAGDTVVAMVAAVLAAGARPDQAAALANIAGGIVVGKAGTAPIRKQDLLVHLTEHDPQIQKGGQYQSLDRVRQAPVHEEWEGALETAGLWRQRGLRIGFTNGCFDLLHRGHVEYLSYARAQCDRLIVGVNSDASVSRLKGEGRPVNDAETRALILAALGAVDMVVVFGDMEEEEDKPVALLKRLRPDILIKGGDYDESGVVGADVVKAYGGRIHLAPLREGMSTTELIRRAAG